MVRCSVPECPNKQGKFSGITFHKFPKDETRRHKWITAVGRQHWTPTPNSLVCSAHFTEENMDRTSLMYVRLRQDAVPTIFSSLPKQLPKSTNPGRAKARQQYRRNEVEHECWQNMQIEDGSGEQHREASLNSECESAAYESVEGLVVLTTVKKENEAGEQVPVSLLLKWSEVEAGESAPGSPLAAPEMNEDNQIEQKPTLADLLEWHEVGADGPASGSGIPDMNNCIMPHIQSVLCTPDTPCCIPAKRKPYTKAIEPKRRKRKTPIQHHQHDNIEDEWDQHQLVEDNLRALTPEALLLECCGEDETCNSEHASSIMSRCSTPQELPVLCTSDTPDIELLKKQLYQSSEQLHAAKKRIRILMQNRRRFQKRIASLKGTCSELKSKNLLNEDKIKFLEKTLGGSYRELFERKSSNSSSASLPLNYSTQLREFATKLYFYSRDAYHYMRQTFQNCLPHPGTLRRWNNPYPDCPMEFNNTNDEMSHESASKPKTAGEAMFVLDENSEFSDHTTISNTDLIHGVGED